MAILITLHKCLAILLALPRAQKVKVGRACFQVKATKSKNRKKLPLKQRKGKDKKTDQSKEKGNS